MKLILVSKFVLNRENQTLKRVLHSLSIEAKKNRLMKRERNLRLKFIIKTMTRASTGTARAKGVEKYFDIWKQQSMQPLPLESTESRESRKNSALIKRQQPNTQMNYRYSYNKTSLGSGNHSRPGSRGPSKLSADRDGAGANQQQPFQCAPQSLQLGAGGQYRSASSMRSGSRESSKAAGAGRSSQKHSNVQGVNDRYATRGQRMRYDNESYRDDEDDEEEELAAENSYNLGRAGNVSHESLGLVQKNASLHDAAAASRSLEVNPNHHEGYSLQDGKLEFKKN